MTKTIILHALLQQDQWRAPQCKAVYRGDNIRATCPITVMPVGCYGQTSPVLCCMTTDGVVQKMTVQPQTA
eukprot:10007-Heterococcus_DN1.PRE.2